MSEAEELSRKAFLFEDKDSKEAFELFTKLESTNTKFYPNIFVVGIVGFVLSYVFVYYGVVGMGLETDSLWLPFIFYILGLSSVFLLWVPKTDKSIRGFRLFFLPISVIILSAFKVIEVAFTIIFAALIAAIPIIILCCIVSAIYNIFTDGPFVWFWDLDIFQTVKIYLSSFFMLLSFIFLVVFDVSIPKNFTIPLIFRVIRLKKKEALSIIVLFLSIVAMSLGEYSDSYFFNNFIPGLVNSLISGASLGYICSKIEIDEFLGTLYRLGKARCLVRMGRNYETYFPLRYVHEDSKSITFDDDDLLAVKTISKNFLYATLYIVDNNEMKKRKTLFKWSPWGVYMGSHEFHSGIHMKSKRESYTTFLETINTIRKYMIGHEKSKYNEIINNSLENTEKLWNVV